jgi:hypothetical protein
VRAVLWALSLILVGAAGVTNAIIASSSSTLLKAEIHFCREHQCANRSELANAISAAVAGQGTL